MSVLAPHLSPAIAGARRGSKNDYRRVVNLSSNELHHPRLAELFASWQKDVDPTVAVRYPYYPQAAVAAADYAGVGRDNLLLIPGSDEGIKIAAFALCGATKRMILSSPNYAAYTHCAQLAGVDVHPVDFQAGFTRDHIAQLMTVASESRPSTVVLTNPNGYTGEIVPERDVQALADTCERNRHILLIDEAYSAFAGIDHGRLAVERDGVIVLRSYSKSMGLAGARLAAFIARKDAIDYIARMNCSNPVSGLSLSLLQHTLTRAHDLENIRSDIARARDQFIDNIRRSAPNWTVWPSKTNFVLIRPHRVEAQQAVATALRDRGIVVKVFAAQDPYPHCLRISIGETAVMEQVLAVIASFAGSAYQSNSNDSQEAVI